MSHSTSHKTEQHGKSTKRQVVDAGIDFFGGVMGGTACVYIGQPLDTVKVKMQTFPKLYKNAFQCFKTTLLQDGIARGLYAGTVPSLAAQIAENSVLFLGYGLCQKAVATVSNKSSVSELNVLENALSGSMAAFFSSLTLCPTELIKCKLQAMREMATLTSQNGGSIAINNHVGPWSLTKQILREEGVKGMFKGLVPTFVREMPGYFFFFGGYELSKIMLTPPGKSKDDLGPLKTVICGGIGGVALWVAIFPSDVIKSRVQIGLSGIEANASFISILQKIVREEGARALYRGLGPTILRTFPATGGLFLAYENTKKYLGKTADWVEIV